MENKYLIIMLDSTAPSFCYYNESKKQEKLSIDNLQRVIEYCYNSDIHANIIYPSYNLDSDTLSLLAVFPHIKILPLSQIDMVESGDLLVINSNEWNKYSEKIKSKRELNIILRVEMAKIWDIVSIYQNYGNSFCRLSVVITDIEPANENQLNQYRLDINDIRKQIYSEYNFDNEHQISILTDRIVLEGMNNCNAGVEHYTFAPNGNFYICPGFYTSRPSDNIGTIEGGLNIVNQHLLQLQNSPICSNCDCYHCRRCVYLNKKMTLELNTPSHQQCVSAHHERNTAGMLLQVLQSRGIYNDVKEIKPLFYLDPLEKITLGRRDGDEDF